MKLDHNNAVGPQVREKRGSKNNALIAVIGVASLVGGLQAATQFFAYRFAYQPILGPNFHKLYPPWAITDWWTRWQAHYPQELTTAGSVGLGALLVGMGIIAAIRHAENNHAKGHKFLHGSARWAERKDIMAASLLPAPASLFGKSASADDGVYVGAWLDKRGKLHYLRHSGPEHVLTYAPTRSGKGVGLVIPTLLSWPHSAVITDLKGELWALTAGWRQKHANNKTLRFEPASRAGGVSWNPLEELRIGTDNEVGDVQNLAQLIVDPDGKGLESHWQKTAFALLVGVILHALYKAKHEGTTASLPSVDAMLANPDRDIRELWMEMSTFGHLDGKPHPAIASAARDMLDRPEEEAGSVLSTAKSYLSLYRDPVVAANVSASDFRIRDLMNHRDPVSLYIVTQPNDKARLRPLVRIMVNMTIRLLADRMEFKNGKPVASYKHRLLCMLDEFPSLGKLEILQESLAFLAGYGIKCYLICQDINQLKSRESGYGRDESITSNCHIQNAYPPNRIETAEHLSRLTGQTTVITKRITKSGRGILASGASTSTSYQETGRPLLTPDECLRMPGPEKDNQGLITKAGDMLICVAGRPAIYGKQPLFFQDPVFKARSEVSPPERSDSLSASRRATLPKVSL